jgi:hypothetical protein
MIGVEMLQETWFSFIQTLLVFCNTGHVSQKKKNALAVTAHQKKAFMSMHLLVFIQIEMVFHKNSLFKALV